VHCVFSALLIHQRRRLPSLYEPSQDYNISLEKICPTKIKASPKIYDSIWAFFCNFFLLTYFSVQLHGRALRDRCLLDLIEGCDLSESRSCSSSSSLLTVCLLPLPDSASLTDNDSNTETKGLVMHIGEK